MIRYDTVDYRALKADEMAMLIVVRNKAIVVHTGLRYRQ